MLGVAIALTVLSIVIYRTVDISLSHETCRPEIGVDVIRRPDGQILYKSINNTGKSNFTLIRTKEEVQIFNSCRQQIGDLAYDHVSTRWLNGKITVYLYRDEIMNDDLISKIQDELYPRNCNVKVIYNWESN